MSRRRYTFADYLDVEEESPLVKHEYVHGEILAMAGGPIEHAALSAAMVGLLMAHLSGTPCRAYSSDLRIRIPSEGIGTYADATVVCDPVERDPASPTHVTNPRVIVEVLSASTEDYDRNEKRLYYQQLPSLREYVLVAQDQLRVEVWKPNNGQWTASIYGSGETATLPSIAFDLDIDQLYAAAGVKP